MQHLAFPRQFALAGLLFALPTGLSFAQDDHSNTRGGATAVELGSCTPGKIDSPTDQDWFKFTIPSGTKQFFAYSTGDATLEATLFKGATVEREFSTPFTGGNFIFVESVTGGLSVGLYFKENPDIPNPSPNYQFCVETLASAIPLENFNGSGNITTSGQLDLFSFEIKTGGQTYVYSTGGTDVDGSLFSVDTGELIEGAGDTWVGKNFLLKRPIPPGKYMIVVNSGGDAKTRFGKYGVHVRTPDNAVPLFEQSRADALSIPGEVDYYQVIVPKKGRSHFFTTGATDTEGSLYDSKGVLATSAGDNWTGNNFLMDAELQPDTYYVAVEGGKGGSQTGAYSLESRKSSNATLIPKVGAVSAAIDPLGDLDYYAIPAKAGRIVAFTSGAMDGHGTLLTEDGQVVAQDFGGAAGREFRIDQAVTEGLYYLAVRGQNNDVNRGVYSLTLSFNPGTGTTISLDGADLPGTSQSYKVNVMSTGAWTATGVPDWVKLSASTGSGVNTVDVAVSANATGAVRTAKILFQGLPHVITQAAANFRAPTVSVGPPNKGVFVLTHTTDAGYNYQLYVSDTLNSWTPSGALIKGTGGPVTHNLFTGKKAGFYRVEVK